MFSINKYLDEIQKQFDILKSKNKYLQEEIKNLEDEHWKDAEMAAMKQQLDELKADSNRGFLVTKEESKEIRNWQLNHINTKHNGNAYAGAIGGQFSYTFTPTSIGVFGSCYCESCKKQAEQCFYDFRQHHKDDMQLLRQKYEELKKNFDFKFTFQEEG